MPRTRSASAHRRVLRAALDLMSSRGVDGTSMDAIAERSGVSKATIYKHWADKEALLLELMADVQGLHARPKFDSGHTRSDLEAVLSYRPEQRVEEHERLMPHLLAYSARNPSFGDAWRRMIMDPPRRDLKHLLQLGIDRGELPPELDLEVCLALLLGPLLYWKLFLRRPSGDQAGLAQQVLDAFWAAFATKPRPRR